MLKILAILGGLFVVYVAYWNYQDHHAELAATQFCSSVVMGSAVSTAETQAKAAGARHLSGNDANPQRYFFQGPIFNGYFCDLTVASGKVIARQVTRKED